MSSYRLGMTCDSVSVSCDHCSFLLLVQAVWSGRLCLHYPTLENLRGGRGEGRAEASGRPFVRSAAGCRLSIAGRPELFSSPNCKIRAKNLACMVLRLIHTPIPPPRPTTRWRQTIFTLYMTQVIVCLTKMSTYAQYHTTRCFRHILNSPSY